MIKNTTILGKTYEYESRKITDSSSTRREIIYKGEILGSIGCRGLQRNGYEVFNRSDLEIGHSQSALAQVLIIEFLLKEHMQKISQLIKEKINKEETK